MPSTASRKSPDGQSRPPRRSQLDQVVGEDGRGSSPGREGRSSTRASACAAMSRTGICLPYIGEIAQTFQ